MNDHDDHKDRPNASPKAAKIMLIRHAEKPAEDPPPHGIDTDGDHDDEALSVRGWQRAGALAVLMAPSAGPLQNAALATPRFVFASRLDKDNGSDRPQQTVAPLIDKLGKAVRVNFEFGIGDERELAARAMACDGPVLISWAHGEIPAIVDSLSLSKKTAAMVPAEWPDERFDLVWVFDLNPTSPDYRFSQQPQLLLSGDKPPE
jgi:hypothetical protein